MTRKMLVADLLCGAGGSSTGAARALLGLGLEMELVCVNHWDVAIETHKKNHPLARHYCQDIATVRPHLIVPEGYLDLLMASPTCTHHSAARGGKPTSDQQRSDPWHIITWLTELRVKRVLIENVPEFIGWGPVDPRNGKPIKTRKGEYFKAWTDTMRRLGFELEYRILNAADYGDATTRRRFFLEARSDGRRLAWPVATHTKRPEGSQVTMFPSAKNWRPAREIIDWSLQGKSIFTRKRPLSPKTLARIYAGAVKFSWPEPFLVILRNHMDAQSVDGPVPTIAAGGMHIGLAQPIMLANRNNNAEKDPNESPMPCATTAPGGGIAVIEPVVINGRKGNEAKGVSIDPIPTLDTKGGVWLVAPIILSQQNSSAPRDIEEPLPTITTGGAGTQDHPGCARHMLVEPMVVTVAHGNSAHEKAPNDRRAQSVDDPLKCIAGTGGQFAVVEPFVLSRQGEGAPRSTDDPTPSQTAKHSHLLIEPVPLVAPYYSEGSGKTCNSTEEALPSVTTKGRFGLVVPVTNSNGGPSPRDVEQPIPTMTTAKGGEFGIVMPITHNDASMRARDVASDPLPGLSGASRGDLAFIAAAFGERDGQAPRVHDISQPAPTICAEGRIQLVEAADSYDIRFRMLEPHELAAAMGFSDEEAKYEFAGNKTEKIKQIGNAVPVNTACALVRAIMADAAVPAKASKVTKRAAA